MSTHFGPSADISSSSFISCSAKWGGGGFYHNSHNDSSFLTLSNSLFTNNRAYSLDTHTRGGGGFEDWKANAYSSKSVFSFFSGNRAPDGVGYDISSQDHDFGLENIVHCFTTAILNSFYNHGTHVDNWLPVGIL